MTKNKMNNLLIGGKKAVLLAMFAAMPLSNINAVNKQPSDTVTEQTETKLTESEIKYGTISAYGVMIFLFAGIAFYFYIWDKETGPYKKNKYYKNLTMKKLKSESVKGR